jgi:hypothetical protein
MRRSGDDRIDGASLSWSRSIAVNCSGEDGSPPTRMSGNCSRNPPSGARNRATRRIHTDELFRRRRDSRACGMATGISPTRRSSPAEVAARTPGARIERALTEAREPPLRRPKSLPDRRPPIAPSRAPGPDRRAPAAGEARERTARAALVRRGCRAQSGLPGDARDGQARAAPRSERLSGIW